jgi:hypothetical protein
VSYFIDVSGDEGQIGDKEKQIKAYQTVSLLVYPEM